VAEAAREGAGPQGARRDGQPRDSGCVLHHGSMAKAPILPCPDVDFTQGVESRRPPLRDAVPRLALGEKRFPNATGPWKWAASQ
jgi:hypothetical protein